MDLRMFGDQLLPGLYCEQPGLMMASTCTMVAQEPTPHRVVPHIKVSTTAKWCLVDRESQAERYEDVVPQVS